MARKNLIGISVDPEALPNTNEPDIAKSRPLTGFTPGARTVPVGGITKSLTNITQKVERAEALEKQLSEGQIIVDLDPDQIDGSFVSDRLGMDQTALADLVEQIRESGQLVPILVRRHPEIPNRYQLAFGHRRLAAVKSLGIKVRAVIRDLTDEQLVINQGQENNARTNLSYIERALFAARLEDRGFGRNVVMSALAVDKAALSRMLSIVRQISTEVIERIGAAPDIGRRRWMEFAEKMGSSGIDHLMPQLSADNFLGLSSDERFRKAMDIVSAQQTKHEVPKSASAKIAEAWTPADKSVAVLSKTKTKAVIVEFTDKDGKAFGEWVKRNLDTLYESFRTSQHQSYGD
jgi:ParB family transcriptional regulator, chromosome partitioning protein